MGNMGYKKKIVLTFGTFDRLHLGHQYYLSEARKYGDYLVTIVARDKTVLRVKGKLPRHTEDMRHNALSETAWSDEVVLGKEDGFERCLDHYKPDIICMGYDQGDVSGKLKGGENKYKIVIIESYKPEQRKSSLLQ